jgi:hypothetical protein
MIDEFPMNRNHEGLVQIVLLIVTVVVLIGVPSDDIWGIVTKALFAGASLITLELRRRRRS